MTEPPALARCDCPRPLAGKKGLVTGIANDRSIAYAVAKGAREAGADLAVTLGADIRHRDERAALRHVRFHRLRYTALARTSLRE